MGMACIEGIGLHIGMNVKLLSTTGESSEKGAQRDKMTFLLIGYTPVVSNPDNILPIVIDSSTPVKIILKMNTWS